MMKHVLLFIALILMLNLYSQSAPNVLWTQTYPFTGRGCAIKEIENNNFIVSAKGSVTFSSFLMKIDSNGDTLWTNTYSSSSQGGNDFVQMSDGGYCISGFDRLIKTSPDGNFQWENPYNYDEILAMDITDSNDLVVCGDEITKLDSYGNELWSYGIPRCYDVKSTNENGFILAGKLPSYNLQQALLLKMDSFGSEDWRIPIGTSGGSYGMAVTETSDNGYVITGSYFMGDSVGWAVFALKADLSGSIIWFNTYDLGFSINPGMSIIETVDNSFIILTSSYQVIKIDDLGNEIWTINLTGYNGGSIEEKREIIQTSDQGFLIAGKSTNQTCRITRLESEFRADFEATPEYSYVNSDIQFFDKSPGNPISWQWDFDNDDIIDSNEQNPIYSYNSSGIYDVTLICSDGVTLDTLTRYNYINIEYIPPAPPTNVQVNITAPDAIITWTAVDTTIFGQPITPDGYVVYYNEFQDERYYFLAFTTNTSYTHQYVTQFSDQMFYRVNSYLGLSDEQKGYLHRLNASSEKISRQEIQNKFAEMRK